MMINTKEHFVAQAKMETRICFDADFICYNNNNNIAFFPKQVGVG